jgi:hypothetical protein
MFTEMGAPGYINVLEKRLGDLQMAFSIRQPTPHLPPTYKP